MLVCRPVVMKYALLNVDAQDMILSKESTMSEEHKSIFLLFSLCMHG